MKITLTTTYSLYRLYKNPKVEEIKEDIKGKILE